MKKLLLVIILLLTIVLLNPFDVYNFIIKDISSISNRDGFEKMINKKHYLIKSIVLNPNKMDRNTYKTIYEFLNIDTIAKEKMVDVVEYIFTGRFNNNIAVM